MKLAPYTIALPDFTQPADYYEGCIDGAWKERKIHINFLLRHEAATVSGFVWSMDQHYSYLPKWGQDVYKALSAILYEAMEKALVEAGWGHAYPETDFAGFYGWRCPVTIWKEFLKEEYRYVRG